MEIRVATQEDAELLDRLLVERAARHVPRWAAQQAGEGRYFLAWDAAAPVGWVSLSWQASPQAAGRHLAELIDLSVVETARRRGVGRALLHAAIEAARERGTEGVGLKVTVANPWNDAARALYASEGFVDAGAGEFDDGYWYWTDDGEKHWDGEPHRYLWLLF
jgi:ribosomal protein S18 acetylase RimI-like enzyme